MYTEKTMQVGKVGVSYCTDTVLRLELPNASLTHASNSKDTKRKWSVIDGPTAAEDGCSLTLGVGHPANSSNSMVFSSATACTTITSAKEIRDDSSTDLGWDFNLQLGNKKYLSPKKFPTAVLGQKFDLELSLSRIPAESSVTSVSLGSVSLEKNFGKLVSGSTVPIVDEGSTSSCQKLGNAVAQWHALRQAQSSFVADQVPGKGHPVSVVSDLSSTMVVMSKNSTNCTGIAQQPLCITNAKNCLFEGCGKGARGSSGLCIAHGGGRRCQKVGCNKGAEGRTVYCKAHGGGRRCQYLGCTKSAEGRTDHCIAHGGGRRCSHEGCTRAARGKSGLCIRHGGGKRCQKENCMRSAEGLSGLCISHGGGRRCQFPECRKGAQGSTMLCKAHGGGKRCIALGCTKGAEGSTTFCKGHGGGKRCSFEGGGVCPKSVHGGTLFCVAHGGGKRCAMRECTKSARGRTKFCVRHGGGKRCKFEGCGKSAQGSTDFCKAHGGGKRCTWGQSGLEIGDQTAVPCGRIARGRTGLCAVHSALMQDEQVHGGGTLGPTTQPSKPDKMEKNVIVEDVPVDFTKLSGIKNNPQGWKGFSFNRYGQSELSPQLLPQAHLPIGNEILTQSLVSLPEGRVHGGNLMAMLASSENWQHICPSTGYKQSH